MKEDEGSLPMKAHKFLLSLCDLIEEYKINSGEFIACIADIVAFSAVKNDAEEELKEEFLENYTFCIKEHKKRESKEDESSRPSSDDQ